MQLYPNNSSTLANFFLLSLSEFLPACFCWSNIFNLSHSSLGSHDKTFVESPEAIIAGDISTSTIDPSPGLFRPIFSISKFISSANSRILSRSCRLEWPTLNLNFVIVFRRSPSPLKDLLVSLKVITLLYRVTVIFPCIKKSFSLDELGSFFNQNWILFSGLKRLTKEEAKHGAIIPLSFNNSKTFSFKLSIALLCLIEDSVIVFVKISEALFSVTN